METKRCCGIFLYSNAENPVFNYSFNTDNRTDTITAESPHLQSSHKRSDIIPSGLHPVATELFIMEDSTAK